MRCRVRSTVWGTQARCRVPAPCRPRRPALDSNGHSMHRGCKSDVRASEGSICMVVSRFLKFLIQIQSAELKSYLKSLHPRVDLCICVGGYMREQREKAKTKESSRFTVTASVVAAPPFTA